MLRSLSSRPLSLEHRDSKIIRSDGRAEIRPVKRTVVIGEALVDRVVRLDGTAIESTGGSPANVALILRRLDRHPTLVTRATPSPARVDRGVRARASTHPLARGFQ
jgi:hypothetical protein